VNAEEMKARQLFRWLRAIVRGEPRGHISDLWNELTGKAVLCGKPPNQYLMLTKYLRK
jgi:hypothetical protein